MSYARKASSKPNQAKSKHQTQAHHLSEEQEKLINDLKKFRIDKQEPKLNPGTKILKPPIKQGSLLRQNPKIGNYGTSKLSQKLSFLTIKEESDEEKKERIRQVLNHCQTPFVWKPIQGKPINDSELAINRLQQKNEEIRDDRKFKWRNFMIQLVLSYELYRASKVTEALEKVKILKATLVELTYCRDWLFCGIKDALWHIIIASETFLCLEKDLVDKADKLINEIQPVSTMKLPSQAGIHGVRAAVFMEYGHRGNKIALGEADKAVQKDRTSAEWHFLFGKCMGRIRRVSQCHELVNQVELDAISEALSLDKANPLYKLYLAQVLREKSFREYKKYKPKYGSELYKKLEKMAWKAKYLYIEARDTRPNCPHILMRCAYGMMKLKDNITDIKFVKECIDKAIELAPDNPAAYHVKGLYYERFHVEIDTALGAMEKAAQLGNFGAAIDTVRMHYRLNRTGIVEELEALAATYEEPCNVQVAYTQAGSYLLFIQKDLVGALGYYIKVIEMDPDSYAMKSHKPIFFRMKDPVNMFDVLLEELSSNTDWNTFSSEDKKILKRFLIKARQHENPEKTERLTVEKILDMSKKQVEKDLQYKRKCEFREKNPKKWRGKNRQRGRGRGKANNENKNVQENSHKIDSVSTSRRGRFDGRDRYQNSRCEVNKRRESSISSVDSDYQRDSRVHRPSRFFLGDSGTKHGTNSIKKDPFDNESSDTGHSVIQSSFEWQRSSHSRDSSICSSSSSEQGGYRKSLHNSRFSKTSIGTTTTTTTTTQQQMKLNTSNLEKLNLENADYPLVRKMSMMSISSAGTSESEKSSSVMDRVKESYAMLNRSNRNNKGKKNFQRSDSTQSLNKRQTNPSGEENFSMRGNVHKSGSMQSLNFKQTNSSLNRFTDYKPSFVSRDSSVESNRSLTFMPSFASKNSES